jgi:hypothetical protein
MKKWRAVPVPELHVSKWPKHSVSLFEVFYF